MSREYLAASSLRFHEDADEKDLKRVYDTIMTGKNVDMMKESARLPFAAE
jgi:hypothetical protein